MKSAVVFMMLTSLAAAQAPKTARKYFEELREAGGFTTTVATTDGPQQVKSFGYVCFNDSASDAFFSFITMVYDERYAKATQTLISNPSEQEKRQALTIVNAIVSRDVYLQYVDDQILSVLPAPTKKFLLDGNQLMNMTSYLRGVKFAEREIHRSKDDALFSGTWTGERLRLNIEPSTLRYVLFNGDYNSSGKCERIFPD